MKKFCFPAALLVILALVICGSVPSAHAQAKKKSSSMAPAVKDSPVAAVVQPDPKAVRGGILKATRSRFPKVIGYHPEMGPVDAMFLAPTAERLVNWADDKGNLAPTLAESWKVDVEKKTLTYYLRKGIKFQDGTPFNAEAVRWNLQLALDGGKLPDSQSVKSIEAVDDYTVRLTLTDITNMVVLNYGTSAPILSPTAINKNGKEWARTHAVGTGPFKLVDFKRDTYIKYEKNKDYWRKGFPYLDGLEIRFVPDPMTASMMLVSKEIDVALDGLTMKNVVDLEKKGMKINWGPGMLWSILPNSKDPKSPFANKKVREAIEYAIDRPALTKMLGFGRYEAVNQLVPSGSPAYTPGFNPRPYNPEKAKALLAEAGYPNGLETKLLIYDLALARDTATALQNFLGAVGIKVTIDPADVGRYYGAVYGPTGFTDLALVQSGLNPDGTDVFAHFGPRPFTYRFGYPAKTPEYIALAEKALRTFEPKAANAALKQVVKKAGEDAMTVPLFRSADALVMQPYFHTDYMKIHVISWFPYKDWLEKKK